MSPGRSAAANQREIGRFGPAGHVGVPVISTDRHARNQMVDHEVVQHDDAGPATERVHDPSVGVGIVADVVERDVRIRNRPRTPWTYDLDLDEPLERGKKQHRVVGDA